MILPESWDNGQPRWVPYYEGVPRHFGVSICSSGEPPYDPGGGSPGFLGRSSLGPPGPPGGGPPGSPIGGPSGPPEGDSSVPLVTQDLKAHPDSHSCGKALQI